MPQLDHIIIFSQIFWLFFGFTFLYVILLYMFLPFLLKSLKSRILIIEHNTKEIESMENLFSEKQFIINKLIENSFHKIKNLISTFSANFTYKNIKSTQSVTDSSILRVILNTTLFCNTCMLNEIHFYPKIYNNLIIKK